MEWYFKAWPSCPGLKNLVCGSQQASPARLGASAVSGVKVCSLQFNRACLQEEMQLFCPCRKRSARPLCWCPSQCCWVSCCMLCLSCCTLRQLHLSCSVRCAFFLLWLRQLKLFSCCTLHGLSRHTSNAAWQHRLFGRIHGINRSLLAEHVNLCIQSSQRSGEPSPVLVRCLSSACSLLWTSLAAYKEKMYFF